MGITTCSDCPEAPLSLLVDSEPDEDVLLGLVGWEFRVRSLTLSVRESGLPADDIGLALGMVIVVL
jgi:hypothetical protein